MSTMTATTAAGAEKARRLRNMMTDKLVKLGSVASAQCLAPGQIAVETSEALPEVP
jgi:hypothetical protein